MDLITVAALILAGAALAWAAGRLRRPAGWPVGRWCLHARPRQLESIERLPLTPNHSLHLVKFGERLLVVAAHPGGCSLLDTGARVEAKAEAAHAG